MEDGNTAQTSGKRDDRTDGSTLYDWIVPSYSRTTTIYLLDVLCGLFALPALVGLLNFDTWLLSLPAHFLVQYPSPRHPTVFSWPEPTAFIGEQAHRNPCGPAAGDR